MDGYSLSDIRAATDHDGYGDGFGMGGGWLAWILLFALFGGNGFGFGGRGTPVTEADLCSSQSFSELKNQVGRLNDNQAAIARQTDNAICSSTYELASKISGVEASLQACCCDLARSIDSVNYNGAMNTAAINANTTAGIQKVLDAISGNRMADMQNQINQLQLAQAMCGVIRYPTATTYAVPSTCFGTNACNTCAY